jgi:3-phosphoshikimate 1-carboxyvinyltransferase
VPVNEKADGFTIHGPLRPHGTIVDSHDDHRLAMSLAICGLVADGPTVVENAKSAHDSFPDFVRAMQSLGADMAWES